MFQKIYKAWRKVIEVSLWFWLASIFLFLFIVSSCTNLLGLREGFLDPIVRRNEAKSLLKLVNENQIALYLPSLSFTACIDDLIDPEMSRLGRQVNWPAPQYVVGFSRKLGQQFECQSSTMHLGKKNFINENDLQFFERTFVEKHAYLAMAIGRPCEGCVLDVWTIDQDKNLVHVQQGIPIFLRLIYYTIFGLVFLFFWLLVARFRFVANQKFNSKKV